MRPWINVVLALVLLADRVLIDHLGGEAPMAVRILAGLLVIYFWLEFFGLWDRLNDFPGGSSWKPGTGKRTAPVTPPRGYTGPFWNKPSAVYLEAKAQPFTAVQNSLALVALLIPFAALIYFLLRW